MIDKERFVELIEFAKEQGLSKVTIDGVDFHIDKIGQKLPSIVEASAEDIIRPMNVLDDLSDEEILYWSSGYFEELQAQKDARANSIKDSSYDVD